MTYSILFIDDYIPSATAMEYLMDHFGYDFGHASNGADAVKMACEKSYDLAFIDVNLPDILGDILAPKIRALCPEAKIIGFTADVNAVSRERS